MRKDEKYHPSKHLWNPRMLPRVLLNAAQYSQLMYVLLRNIGDERNLYFHQM